VWSRVYHPVIELWVLASDVWVVKMSLSAQLGRIVDLDVIEMCKSVTNSSKSTGNLIIYT